MARPFFIMAERYGNSGTIDAGYIQDDPYSIEDSWFYQAMYPGKVQEKQFDQQKELLKLQNTEGVTDATKAKFKALQDLGVNPLTISEGLAGSSSGTSAPSVPAPPSSGTIPEMLSSAGDIADRMSAAKERNTLLEERKKNIISDTFLKYKQAGYTDLQSKALAIANAYLPTEKFLGIVTLTQNIENLRAEYKSVMQGIEESKKRVEELDAQIRLADATGNLQQKLALEAEKRTLLIEAQTTEQNWFNDIRKQYGIDPKSPLENNLLLAGVKGDEKTYQTGVGIVYDTAYNNASGQYDADEEHAYSLSKKKALGEAYASWFSRPNSIGSLVADSANILNKLKDKIKNAVKDSPAELEKIKHTNEFLSAYSSFRADLKRDVDEKRKAYKQAKRSGMNREEVTTRWRVYQNALNAYDDFDEDDFSDLLLNQ